MGIQASNKSTVSSGLGKKRMEHSNRDIDNTLMNKLFAKPRLKKTNEIAHPQAKYNDDRTIINLHLKG